MARTWQTVGVILGVLASGGCGAPPVRGSPSMPMPASQPAAYQGASPPATPAEDPSRPGLGTEFGERRDSRVTQVSFERADPSTPFAQAVFWYNDQVGADAMTRSDRSRRDAPASASLVSGGLVVSLVSERGLTLPGLVSEGRVYAIGEASSRYGIRIQNRTQARFEVVASVDGLDVIKGTKATPRNDGYVLEPGTTFTIEGFRTSDREVAAFRFGSVRGSYASRSGEGDRNVGVIGVLFFNERGSQPVYTPEEVERRKDADPFPGRYSVPPPR